MKKLAVLLGATALAVGCSSMKVNNDFDREADFSNYETYSWRESDMTVKDSDPLGHDRLIEAIEGQMRANGFQKASSDSDVVITYNVEETEEMNLNTTYMGGGCGMGPGWGWGAGGMRGGMGMGAAGMGTATTQVRKYNVGTLVLDMWDVKEHRLVYPRAARRARSTLNSKVAPLRFSEVPARHGDRSLSPPVPRPRRSARPSRSLRCTDVDRDRSTGHGCASGQRR